MESAGLHFICFICLFLFIFIYFHWFSLISLISSIPTYFPYFYYFVRVCQKKIGPSFPKQVRFKNANRTRKLENRTVSFFLVNEFRIDLSIPVIKISTILWRKKSYFWDFRRFLYFLEAPSRHFQEFGARPKDFNAFWSPAEGF